MSFDSSHRHAPQRPLRLDARHLELLQRAGRIGAWEWDLASGRVRWSEEMFALHGIAPEDFAGTAESYLEFVHPDDRQQVQSNVSDPEAPQSAHYRIIRPSDGRVAHMLGVQRALPAADGAVDVLYGTVQDVSAVHESEAARRRSEAGYRELVQRAVFGIYRSTPDGRFTMVNPALARMLGFESEEELLERGVAALYEDPAERQRVLAAFHARPDGCSVEVRWLRKDGQAITVRLSSRALEEGGASFYEGVVEDITGERELERELRQAQKMDAIGRLAGGVAHDFNNLLTVIIAEAEQLGAESGTSAAVRETAARIVDSAERAAALTKRLLTFSSKDIGRHESIDCNELLRSAVEMLDRVIPENIVIETDLVAEAWPLEADRSQLEQVLVNLAVNARDAMPEGGTLRLQTRNQRVGRFFAHRHPEAVAGEYVRVRVADDGVGMADDVRSHIFEPFFSTKGEQGTGLGLPTCYATVRAHGGFLVVDSAPGRGTVMDVYLPRAAAPGSAAEPNEDGGSFRGSGTVLLVEDGAEVRKVLSGMLSTAGFEVRAADSAEAALDLLQGSDAAGDFDLLITDVVLPGMGGRELAARALELSPGLAVLYISGYPDDTRLLADVQSGERLLLRKPFSSQKLGEALREALHRQPPPTSRRRARS